MKLPEMYLILSTLCPSYMMWTLLLSFGANLVSPNSAKPDAKVVKNVQGQQSDEKVICVNYILKLIMKTY